MKERYELRAEYDWISNSVRFAAFRLEQNWLVGDAPRVIGRSKSITIESIEPGQDGLDGDDPTFIRVSREDCQRLMDDLWRAGVRPRDVGGLGELQAMQKHLADMRVLAFSYLKLDVPK